MWSSDIFVLSRASGVVDAAAVVGEPRETIELTGTVAAPGD
jgi:hypothetical protein